MSGGVDPVANEVAITSEHNDDRVLPLFLPGPVAHARTIHVRESFRTATIFELQRCHRKLTLIRTHGRNENLLAR